MQTMTIAAVVPPVIFPFDASTDAVVVVVPVVVVFVAVVEVREVRVIVVVVALIVVVVVVMGIHFASRCPAIG